MLVFISNKKNCGSNFLKPFVLGDQFSYQTIQAINGMSLQVYSLTLHQTVGKQIAIQSSQTIQSSERSINASHLRLSNRASGSGEGDGSFQISRRGRQDGDRKLTNSSQEEPKNRLPNSKLEKQKILRIKDRINCSMFKLAKINSSRKKKRTGDVYMSVLLVWEAMCLLLGRVLFVWD